MIAENSHLLARQRLDEMGIAAVLLPPQSTPFPMWLIQTPEHIASALPALLSKLERERADRFLRPDLYRRYVSAHGAMRLLCEAYFHMPAHEQHFRYGRFNKPHLTNAKSAQCNLSYSGDFAVIGMSVGNPIGVDLERRRHIEDAQDVIDLQYSEMEARILNRAVRRGYSLDSAFLRIWVRKEACLKALGCGLTVPLNQVHCGVGSRKTTVRFGDRQIRTGVFHVCDRFDFSSPCDLIVGWAQLN